MASVLDKKVVKDDRKFLGFMIFLIIVNIWFFTAPSRRMTQIGLLCNSIKYKQAQLSNDNSLQEYMYHRNNAAYLVKLNNKRRTLHAIKEMDMAINTVPEYVSPEVVQGLYKDRAYIKLFAGDKKGALDDLLLSGNLDINDNMKAAALLIDRQAYSLARKHCMNIINENNAAIAGYVCLSRVYEQAGKLNSARKIYDYAIETKKPANPKLYAERALFRHRTNDFKGYDEDVAIAKKLSSSVNLEISMMEDAINPKEINLVLQ